MMVVAAPAMLVMVAMTLMGSAIMLCVLLVMLRIMVSFVLMTIMRMVVIGFHGCCLIFLFFPAQYGLHNLHFYLLQVFCSAITGGYLRLLQIKTKPQQTGYIPTTANVL